MGKRRNEQAQMSKEDFEAQMDREDTDSVPAVFEQASAEQLEQRRIVRRSTRPPSMSPATNTPVSSSVPLSSNPFAGVKLSSDCKPLFSFGSKPTDGTSVHDNQEQPKPYATPSPFLFGTSAPAPKISTISFAPPPSGGMFQFSPAASTTSASAISRISTTNWGEKSAELDRTFRETVLSSSWDGPQYHSKIDKAYLKDCFAQETAYVKEKEAATATIRSSPSKPATSESTAFGTFGKFAQSTSSNFSKTPTPTAFAPIPDSSTADNDDNAGEAEDEDTMIQPASDPDWEMDSEFGRVFFYHLVDTKKPESGYAGFGSGTLRIQKNSKTGKYRMLMRNPAGIKVLINILITSDMTFKLTASKRKGQDATEISFFATTSLDRGYEQFRVVSLAETGKKLHKKLESLASVS
jgi:hypothetical protein